MTTTTLGSQIDGDPADDLSPPTWQDLRDRGEVLIDDDFQRLGVYAARNGAVVVMEESVLNAGPHYTVFHHSFVPMLVAALTSVQAEAAILGAAMHAEDAKEAKRAAAFKCRGVL